MAEYVESFGSKLDWAMPFQRTGKFPLDRTNIFSSYEDILAYAKQDGSDSRQLGGTSYVGQIVVNYGPGPEVEDGVPGADEVAAYVITAVGSSPAVQKLAQSSSTGDYGQDIANLQSALSALTGRVDTAENGITDLQANIGTINANVSAVAGNVSSLQANVGAIDTRLNTAEAKLNGIEDGAEVNILEGVAVQTTAGGGFSPVNINAKIAEIDLSPYALKSDISTVFNYKGTVDTYANLPSQDQVTGDVYIVTNGEGAEDNQEYVWDGTAWEALGTTVDLSGYATTANVTQAIATATNDMATQTWVTGQLGSYATTANVTSAIETATDDMATNAGVDAKLADYATTANVTANLALKANAADLTSLQGNVTAVEALVNTKVNATDVAGIIANANINGSKVNGAVALANQVAGTLTAGSKTYNGSAPVEITAADLGALTAVPVATNATVGGILVGYTSAGTNYAVEVDDNGAAFVNVPVPEVAAYNGVGAISITANGANYDVAVAENGILTSMIADGQITTAKIASNAVTKDKIASVSTDAFVQGDNELVLNGGTSAD